MNSAKKIKYLLKNTSISHGQNRFSEDSESIPFVLGKRTRFDTLIERSKSSSTDKSPCIINPADIFNKAGFSTSLSSSYTTNESRGSTPFSPSEHSSKNLVEAQKNGAEDYDQYVDLEEDIAGLSIGPSSTS